MTSTQRPLAGIRVLDFTHAAAGPFATVMLADLGAEVIKVEKPGRGDGSRFMGKPMLGPRESDYYVSLNRNKRDIAIDLGTDEGKQVALELAEVSDIIVQNFRPGVMDRLGLGFDEISRRRPGIIYCSLSAFGSSGPLRDRPANDIIMQAVSGLMGITGEVGGGPVRVGAPIADFGTGLFGTVGILSALYARDQHPEGQHIEVAMLDSVIALMSNYIPSVVGLGETVPRCGRTHAQIVPYQAFECSDGAYVMVGAFTNGFWRRLCEAIAHPEWISDDRFVDNADRLENRGVLVPMIEEIFRTRTREEWLEVLEQADVPASPVLELHEAVQSPQAQFNQVIHNVGTDEAPLPTARFPVRSTSWPLAESKLPPRIGQDSVDILDIVLGKDPQSIDELVKSGAVGVAEQAAATS
ncbi:CaiB/BaiF CoA transferase family protein [Rhodococcus opacus]|uniref:CaiB/BaiF CoA transferase family protein n=1 Tax=Rhodococcus opacus TaxID=37919 RepID=UPI002476FA98|nr:CoA transferase [Rhodococcus opacus]MDH6293298.1 crotonobetainyl-CoA:carnitine CoA-transferase CaiB-like acyl-CoA transferase [Rhodococcus opacus]